MPPGHLTDAAGSYGGVFSPADSLGPVLVDVPVDLIGTVALFVEHSASRPQVEWGDELDYTVRIAITAAEIARLGDVKLVREE